MLESIPSPVRTANGYVFGRFRLDVARRILYSGSLPTPIPERIFQILLTLIRAGGAVIPRDVLAHEVWGDSGVTDTNLNQHVYLLRLLLHERKEERNYIVTVPREGYRFAGTAMPVTAAALDTTFLIEEELAPADAANESFALFCRGSYLLDRRTARSLRSAIEAAYVPALLGLARAHALLAQAGEVPPRPAFDKAQTTVERALRLDPRSSTAHAILSELNLFGDWNWSRAGRSAQTALSLNPQSVLARNSAAWYHVCRGDVDRGLVEAAQALLVEPASLSLQLLQARMLLHCREYRKSIAATTNILLTDPDYRAARRYRGAAYVLDMQYGKALEDLNLEEDADSSFALSLIGRAHAGLGNRYHASKIYEELRERRKRAYVPAWDLAVIAEGAGSPEETMRHLEGAFIEREPNMLFLRTLRWFRSVERRPEFKRLLRRIGPAS